jgi:polyisoprenyl-teichoic acid--peptidoglycan teichoic acid transferase
MSVYGGEPPNPPRRRRGRRRRVPRWARYTLSVLGLLLVVVLAAGGYELWYLNQVYNKVTKLTGFDIKASHKLAANIPTSSQPITALLIGSDHRSDGATGKNGLSDTLMLARMDPKHHMVSLLSIPRDLWVPSLGNKINSAYSEGGDAKSLEAVEAVTGVKPNYLMNVDFSGFQKLVDTLGGVYLNVDQYYYNPLAQSQYTGFSAIDVKPGYQKLNGADALAFSRYRHTDDDFHRQARQQMFLRAFEVRASARFHGISVLDIPSINRILGALSSSVTIVGPGGKAPSPRTLLTFAATAYQARSHVVSIHVSWTSYLAPGGADAVQVTNFPQAIFQWKHPWLVSRAAAALPTGKHKPPAHAWTPAVTPATVKVTVLNGNGIAHAASKTVKGLKAWGYRAHPGNAPSPSTRTWVYYRPGDAAAAGDLAHILGKSTTAAIPSAVAAVVGPRVQVAVVIGAGFTGKLAVAAPQPAKTHHPTGLPATITPTNEYRADFVHAQQVLKFPIMYPTVAQADSSLCPWVPVPDGPGVLSCQGTSTSPTRIYGIAAAGKGWNSMYAVFKFPSALGPYWGIEETRFTAAPLLATPNATRTLDGRKYLFFFNGNHIQTIAFIQNGIAYWVQNSLLDDLTDPEMVAIARSLKPVR